MAASVLKPIHVSAKVILAETKVPALGGKPFNRDAGLEKGIHVHWALPDSLTHAKLLPKKGKNLAVFPGVPDVWLVIRFNPGPPLSQIGAKRTWRAWMVDSVEETVRDLASWTPPARDPKLIHTFAGVLPEASSLGYGGWGTWDSDQPEFDPAVAAYYPSARKRFGFYDNLSDLAGKTGNVSYVVIGWFVERGHDPMNMAEDRFGMVNHWKTLHHTRANAYTEIAAKVVPLGMKADPPQFEIREMGISEQPAPSDAKQLDIARMAARGGTLESQFKQMEKLNTSFPPPPIAADMPVQAFVDQIASLPGPKDTVCHGSVCEVPLKGGNTSPVAIKDEDIRLFPSIRRALAELAALNVNAPEQLDGLEMMLDDLEAQKGSVGGVIDMPGNAHALTFQGLPGMSKWYARLEIHPASQLVESAKYFDVAPLVFSQTTVSAGYWPKMMLRSASEIDSWMISDIPPVSQYQPPPQQPQGPTPAQMDTFRTEVRSAFQATATAAAAAGKPIQPRLLNVLDKRKDAQPTNAGRVIGSGAGTDGASWWVDIDDDHALNELLRSIGNDKVYKPSANNLYEEPGPRWNRPWAPQLLLFGTGRSYKHGFDGRFRADGYVAGRLSGEVMTGFAVGSNGPVYGYEIMDKPNVLFSMPGLPPEARALVSESLLMDTESATVMTFLSMGGRAKEGANLDVVHRQMTSAVRGMWLTRDPKITVDYSKAFESIATYGTFPSAIAVSPWQDPRDPLFVDVNYSHPYSSLEKNWSLAEEAVECSANDSSAVNPPDGNVEVIEERSRVTATPANVLKSSFVTKLTLDIRGNPARAMAPPKGVTEETFTKMDVLSAPLTLLDSTLIERGRRERTGALRINQLELVDMFGLARNWKSGIDPASSAGGPNLPYWTELTPRLPYWSRLNFRLQWSNNTSEEATPLKPPVCGILVPDFLEHALEVFDGAGNAIGQLTTDRPRFGSTNAVTLQVKFELHPWVAANLNPPPGSDPADSIANPILKSLVKSLVAQSMNVPANASQADWFETGLSAMLRSIDTVRATLDPTKRSDDRKVKLLGEPILVLAGRLRWEGAATTNPKELAGTPPLHTAPPDMPVLSVRIGSVTRPDDGVLGCFISGATPQDGRFAPVKKEAAEKAILNGLAMGVPMFAHNGLAVKHPFVKDQEARFDVPANTDVDIVILADIRGGLYATCGALPRKKINMPKEFIDAAVKNLEPTFRVGPILTTKVFGAVKALAPPPDIEGLAAEYVYRQPGESGAPETFPEVPVPPPPPVGELPNTQAVLTDGWLRVFRADKGNA